MKYINKKLPLVPVGMEISYLGDVVHDGVHCFDSGNLYCTPENLKRLISEGWIEEVKPREWNITIDNETGLILRYPDGGTVIKVREVIE